MKNNPKSKTQKKTDNRIRLALTSVCEQSLKDVAGFQWLTHQADYSNFPASLLITCVFDTDDALEVAHRQGLTGAMKKNIQVTLLKIGVRFKGLEKQVIFDTEEACINEDGHDWSRRSSKLYGRAVPNNGRP